MLTQHQKKKIGHKDSALGILVGAKKRACRRDLRVESFDALLYKSTSHILRHPRNEMEEPMKHANLARLPYVFHSVRHGFIQ